jgi:hypothetical protein
VRLADVPLYKSTGDKNILETEIVPEQIRIFQNKIKIL